MTSLEYCFANADILAQEVLNAWGVNMAAYNANDFTPEFKSLLEAACEYRSAKSLADNHREFDCVSEAEVVRENSLRRSFARMAFEFELAHSEPK